MCGYCGIFEPRLGVVIDRDLLTRMTRMMTERGPDAEGLHVDGPLGVGHRRLTIIDLEAGEQPVFNEDHSIYVVFNGEIFNYQDIRAELISRGHQFRTKTDTEVIVHAYEEYGEACVDHFRGMFSFALYDKNKQKLFIARDRFGIKPLYYVESGGRLLFASEVKPLLLAAGGRAAPDPRGVEQLITVGYGPVEGTIFRGIKKLRPGHTLVWEGGTTTIRQYWDLPDTPALKIGFDEARERLIALLRESTRLRMISDVPIGAFLSGGVDSSVVVSLLSELSPFPIKTFSLGYSDSQEHNELPYAKRVAERLGTDHTEHILSSGDFFDNLSDFVYRTEEPIVDPSGIALYHLAKRARQDVKVILSGEGGDEILAGYPIYRKMARIAATAGIRSVTGIAAASRLGARMVSNEKLIKYLDWAGRDVQEFYLGISNDVTHSMRSRIYSDEFLSDVGGALEEEFEELFAHQQHASTLRRMSYVDFKTWLANDQLLKADKMTMAASLELRVPLLDHKLAEFCFSLPDELRLSKDGVGKVLLKSAAETWLPNDIIYRKKQGFPTPVAEWFRGHLFERVSDLLLSQKSMQRGYFKKGYVEQILKIHQSGAQDLSRRILAMVILELWHIRFIDSMTH